MIPDPEDWWHEYEPEPIPGVQHLGGRIVALIVTPILIAAVAWTSLRARWRK